jgi:ATP-dependent helicase/nuclease subunit A
VILTPEQLRAVTRWGQDACVVAGPGSGKTTVLVERYAWLLTEKSLQPHQILAITFTEKAAHEIKQRLAARFRGDTALQQQIERAPVATIHGFCARLLRRFAIAAGLDPQFEILDENRQRTELASAIRETLDRMAVERQTDLRRLLIGWRADDPEQALTELYDAWRSSGGTLADLRRQPKTPGPDRDALLAAADAVTAAAPLRITPALHERLRRHREWVAAFTALPAEAAPFDLLAQYEFSLGGQRDERLKGRVQAFRLALEQYEMALIERHFAPARRLLVEAFHAAATLYQQKKRARAALDFSDLETECIRLLESSAATRRRVQAEFAAVLMDELQDTNPQQWKLIDLIRPAQTFFAVGDINQSIFGFRHAEPRVFADYRDKLLRANKEVDYLRGNNRSRQEILRAVEQMADGVSGIEAPSFEPRVNYVASAHAPAVEFLHIEHDDRAQAEELEAQWVARRIRECEAQGVRLRDIAVLVRNTSGLDLLEQALRDFAVPFVMNRGRQFFEEQEVRDLIHWLRVIDNPRDELALLAVLRSPLFGRNDDEIFGTHRAGEKLQTLIADRLAPYRRLKDDWPPDRLVARLLDESGYWATLTTRARGNVDKLLGMLRERHVSDPRPLADVIRSLDQLRLLAVEPNAPEQPALDAVQVLTIHASKGLEWPVVFVMSLQRGTPTSPPAVSFVPGRGLGVQWRHPVTHAGVADGLQTANLDERRQRESEESHRLLYVAMTRAAERLVLTTAGMAGKSDWPALVDRAIPAHVLREPPPRFDLPERSVESPVEPQLVWIDPPAHTAYDSSVSITRLLDYRRCPRQAFLKSRVPHVEETAESAANTGADFGRAVHEVLAGLRPGEPHERALAERFLHSELGRRAARAAWSEREYDFMVEIEGVILRGQIDLVFEEAGELVVVDYKTDKSPDDTRLDGYRMQMHCYALAVERAWRRPDRGVIFVLRESREVEVTPEPERARELVRRWRDDQSPALQPGPHCGECGFYQRECASPWAPVVA